jgi:multicomponent Na+:H+ antiporter subunit F
MMNEIENFAAQAALVVLIGLLLVCVYRVWVGPTPADRLQAIDTITTLLIGIIVLLALVQDSGFVIDVGLGLAALSFVGTLAIARYISDGKVF